MEFKGTLGERMKYLEKLDTRKFKVEDKKAIIIRIDGKAFHTFTRGLERPFDETFIRVMQRTTFALCNEIQGVDYGYVQSDEISLVIMPSDNPKTSLYFDGKIQKLVSVISSMTTLYFNKYWSEEVNKIREEIEFMDVMLFGRISKKQRFDILESKQFKAMFDCRAFQIGKDEVSNYIMWRQRDAIKNSINVFAHFHFSNKQLSGKNSLDRIEMLKEKGIDFKSQPLYIQRGTSVEKNDDGLFMINYVMPIIKYDVNFLK